MPLIYSRAEVSPIVTDASTEALGVSEMLPSTSVRVYPVNFPEERLGHRVSQNAHRSSVASTLPPSLHANPPRRLQPIPVSVEDRPRLYRLSQLPTLPTERHVPEPGIMFKKVYRLHCRHCSGRLSVRSMKAILLADTRVELYSTDLPSRSVQLLDKDYTTRTCGCFIRDFACLGCGNVVGYHIISPCRPCLQSCNNGHFWMFHSETCSVSERCDHSGQNTLLWNHLPRPDLDEEYNLCSSFPITPYHERCR
ncbi:FAM72 protein-domain-containing protein [Spinellus fusiger]|nr:FAM72 protein-domain-containing protein [Spinellus fusiger]